jgi:hypothetical protein
MTIPILSKLLIGALLYEGTIGATELHERFNNWNWARDYCDQVGKPLLRIGMHRGPFEPPNGDYTLDVDPAIEDIPGGVLGDERNMPFCDKQFGVCFNEHTLEHLHDAQSVEMAVNECRRVADYAVLLCPSPYSIYATLFCPSHRLRLWFDNKNNRIVVKPNTWATGFGWVYEGDTGGARITQQMILNYDEMKLPIIIEG